MNRVTLGLSRVAGSQRFCRTAFPVLASCGLLSPALCLSFIRKPELSTYDVSSTNVDTVVKLLAIFLFQQNIGE